MEQKQFTNEGRQIPPLGSNIFLDYKNVTQFDLTSEDKIEKLVLDALQLVKQTPQQIEKNSEVLADGTHSINLLATFEDGYLSAHVFQGPREVNIDFFHAKLQTHEEKLEGLKQIEVHFCDAFGWNSTTQVFVVPRGFTTRLYFNETANKSEMMQEADFIDREANDKSDVRVYRSKIRDSLIFIVNNVLIWSKEIKGTFNQDITKNLLKKDQQYKNVLVIGGFDLSLTSYLLQNYPNVEKITVVWDDEKILSMARKHLDFARDAAASERVTTVINEPLSFVKQAPAGTFDAVLIDAPTSWAADYADPVLTSYKFYNALSSALAPGSGFSQLFGYEDRISNILSDIKEVGFSDTSTVVKSKTASYSEEVLIVTIFKQTA